MRIIDDEGFVFGLANVIDLLFVLLVLSFVVGGVAFVTASSESSTTQKVTVRTTPQPDYVIKAIGVGPTPSEGVVAIESKAVSQTDKGQYVAVLEVKLRVSLQGNVPMFQNERLYIGRTLTFDFGRTIVEGTVIDMTPIGGGD